jgi:hypothetical protein
MRCHGATYDILLDTREQLVGRALLRAPLKLAYNRSVAPILNHQPRLWIFFFSLSVFFAFSVVKQFCLFPVSLRGSASPRETSFSFPMFAVFGYFPV